MRFPALRGEAHFALQWEKSVCKGNGSAFTIHIGMINKHGGNCAILLRQAVTAKAQREPAELRKIKIFKREPQKGIATALPLQQNSPLRDKVAPLDD